MRNFEYDGFAPILSENYVQHFSIFSGIITEEIGNLLFQICSQISLQFHESLVQLEVTQAAASSAMLINAHNHLTR